MNEPQILKQHRISNQAQIMYESQFFKDDQISNETQIKNKHLNLKQPQNLIDRQI